MPRSFGAALAARESKRRLVCKFNDHFALNNWPHYTKRPLHLLCLLLGFSFLLFAVRSVSDSLGASLIQNHVFGITSRQITDAVLTSFSGATKRYSKCTPHPGQPFAEANYLLRTPLDIFTYQLASWLKYAFPPT